MAFDFKAARDAGYSDAEIVGFLRESGAKFDFDAAQKAGYGDADIASFLEERADTLFPKEKGLGQRLKEFGSGIIEQTKEDLGFGKGALDQPAPAAKDTSSKASPVAPMRQDYYEKLRRASIAAPDAARERAEVGDTTGRALTHIEEQRARRADPQQPPALDLSSSIDTQQIAPVQGEEPYSFAKELGHQKANLSIGVNNLVKGFYHGQRLNEAAQAIETYEKKYSPEQLAALPPEKRREYESFKRIYSNALQASAAIDEENSKLFEKTSPAIQKLFSLQGKEWSAKTLGEIGDIVVANPRVIPDIAMQSGPASASMIMAAVLARAGGFSLGGAALAGGAGSGLIEFGNAYTQKRMEGKTHPEAYGEAVARAGLVGIFDAASLNSAGRAMGTVMLKSGMAKKGWETVKELGKQAGYGMAGESAGAFAAGETPDPVEVAAEGLGELATGPLEMASMGRRDAERPRPEDTAPLPADNVLGRPEEPEISPAPPPRETADFEAAQGAPIEAVPDEPIPFRQEDVDLGRAEGAYDTARAAEEAARAREAAALEGIPYEPDAAPAPPEPAPTPLPPKESVAAAFEVAERDAAAQRDREMDALAREARDLRADEQISTAEARGQGLVEGAGPVEAAMESTRIFGRAVETASDAALQLVAEKGRGEAQKVARAELAKRAFERDLKAAGDPGTASTLAAIRSAEPGQKLASRPAFERLAEARPELQMEYLEGDAVPKHLARAADLITAAIGKQVVFVRADPAKFEGTVFTDTPDTIYLNANSRRAMRKLVGHETLHSLKRSNPRVYGELLSAISKTARGRAAAERYVKRYGDMATDIQIEEMVADMRGDFMDDPKFWLEVFRASKQPLVKKLAQMIRMIFDTLRMKLRIGERRTGYRSAELIEDIEAARKAFAKAYAEWEAQPTAPLRDASLEELEQNNALASRADGGGSLPNDEIRKAVAERESEMRAQVAVWKAQGRYKWDRGQVLLSKSTGKLWTILSQFVSQKRNDKGAKEFVPMYVAQHSNPEADDWIKSTLYADKAHESMVPVGKEMLDSRPDLKALLDKLPKDEQGKFKAAPERTARDVWNLVQRMEAMAKEGEQSKGWYTDSAKEMLRAFGGNKVAAKIFAQVIAITSANTEVKANFTQADKALFQFAQGRAISVGTGSVDEKLNDLLYFGIPWEGRKTNVFYTNLVEAIDGKRPSETTQDMHMGMIGFGKKKITDDEYTFMDLVTKHVAARVGMTPQQAQAAIWVTQKARSLVERYEEKGWHSDKTPQTKRRMALVDAGINYGDLIRGRGWFWPDAKTEFQKAREVRAKGMQVTAEVKPSTKLEIGQAVANLSIAKLQAYQRDALARVFGARGPAALMEEMGLDRSKYRVIEGAGGYDASMAPNEIITLNVDRETATRVAKAWMYIFKQDAVPFFRTDDKLRADPNAAQAVKIRFAERLSNPLLRKVYDSLREQVHPGIGLTKLDYNVIAIVNFRADDTGEPFLMPDPEFIEKIGEAVQRNALGAKINGYGRFGAETAYPYHDWSEDREGSGLLASASGGRPDLQDRLRRWADAFGRFAEKRGGKALESRPEEVDTGEILDARAQRAATSEANDKPLPTEAQKAAGNYQKGHVRLIGLDITIENPEGSVRTWKRANGSTGFMQMKAHYGYIKGTEGADGDHLDIFIKPGTPLDYDGPVYIADQTKSGSNRFDEHKVFVGWDHARAVYDAYKENYSKGWDGLEGVVKFDTPTKFKAWLSAADLNKRAGTQVLLESKPEDPTDLDFTSEPVVVPIDEVDTFLETRNKKTDTGRAGARFNLRIEWASRPRDGDWVSLTADGRYRIGIYDGGYTVEVDEEIVAWFKTRSQAIAKVNAVMREEVEKGKIPNPVQERSPLVQHTAEQWNRVVDGWKRLASNPVIFRYKTSQRQAMIHIAEDMGVIDRIIDIDADIYTDEEYGGSKEPSSVDYRIKFFNETIAQIHHSVRHKEAHIDAQDLVKDSQMGSILYQLALTWGHNNGVKIVPDPHGLTLINTYRRTEQMLSNALRFGKTKHMRPHKDQGLWGWEDAPKTEADDRRNIALMMITSMQNVMAHAPERAKHLIYNFAERRFEYGPTAQATLRGRVATTADLEKMVKDHDMRRIGAGRTTLARAIFTKSLIHDEEGAKPFLEGKVSVGMVLAGPEVEQNLQLYSQPDERFAPAKPGLGARFALAAAKAATVVARPLATAADIANATMDMVAKIPGVPVAKLTGHAYDRFMSWQSNFWRAGEVRQAIAHAVTADYGLPEPYLDRRDERDIQIQKHLRKSKAMVDRIAALDDAESMVAYQWMQEKPDEAEEQRLLALLPEGSRQALAQMKSTLADLGREAVDLGLISQETYERNNMAYLHRSYKKYEVQNPQAVAASQRAKTIRADSFRGRGLRDDVAAERLPAAQKGDKYVRLELRAAAAAGLGRLKRVIYLKAGTPIPAAYAGWKNDGVWEARFMDRPGAVGLWRDFTRDERERMGEIREVRYAFARTVIGLVHDVETAKFLKWVMENHSVADEEAVHAKGGTVADAVDNAVTLKSYADNEWVEVPGTVAQGTRIFKYGALQSRYIPGHLWNDIRSTINVKSSSAVWRLYDELLTAWKISKTALSPTVHTNNVMANLVFMDIQDIKNRHLVRALQTLIDAERGNEQARALLERYLDSGAELGTPALHELRKEIIEPLLGKLQGEENETLAQISTIQAIGLAARGNVRQSWAALSSKGAARIASKPFHVMLAAYQLEDSVFRMAAWLKEVDEGKSDRDAGTDARKYFLDYRINAPWIQALRRGPFPFLAFTYRAVPLMAEAMAKKPWKLMKYAAAGYLLNSLAYAMLGLGGDDEDRERALLPEEKSGRTILGVPRLLRMPWNDTHGSPVFLDIRRWIPGGDLFDIHGSHSAIPMPQWLAIGGFWGLAMELTANKNAFTGREIWKESDTNTERMMKVFDHLFRFMAPNVPFPNPLGYAADVLSVEKGMLQTYSWRGVQAAGSGVTDDFGRERSLPQALASSVGVKLASYPPDQLRRNLIAKRDAELRDLNENTARYKRELRRGGLKKEEFDARMQKQAEKRREIRMRYADKLGLESVSR